MSNKFFNDFENSEFEKKEIRKTKCINYTVFAIFSIIIVLLSLGYCSYKHSYEYSHTFSQERWLQYPDKRAKMTADLFEKYELVGMTETEIVNLLGQNNNDYGYFNKDNRFVYYLGEERTIIDSEWLLLDFKDGVVYEYSMTQD